MPSCTTLRQLSLGKISEHQQEEYYEDTADTGSNYISSKMLHLQHRRSFLVDSPFLPSFSALSVFPKCFFRHNFQGARFIRYGRLGKLDLRNSLFKRALVWARVRVKWAAFAEVCQQGWQEV